MLTKSDQVLLASNELNYCRFHEFPRLTHLERHIRIYIKTKISEISHSLSLLGCHVIRTNRENSEKSFQMMFRSVSKYWLMKSLSSHSFVIVSINSLLVAIAVQWMLQTIDTMWKEICKL